MSKVMVVAVHPDDETLGCGGSLLKHKANGDEIHWVIVTTAKTFPGITEEKLQERDRIVKKVSDLYNFNSVTELELPTIEIDALGRKNVVGKISKVISEVEPDTLYLPFAYDVHSDHRVVFECAYSCTKSFRYPFIKKIYMMETLSETEFAPSMQTTSFIPNVFKDISSFFDKKSEAMSLYESEIGEHPFPRSLDTIKAQAMLRGSMCGVQYAEAFMLLKEIN